MNMGLKSKKQLVSIISAFMVITVSIIFVACNKEEKSSVPSTDTITNTSANSNVVAVGGDLTIHKNEITETAKFYPYEVAGTKMEVVAVKASDGSIKTVLNTCQVCFDSGKGYFKQEGNELVCQNCKNRFKIDQIAKVKGGCNPIPILKENITEDTSDIVVSKDFLIASKSFFGNWKK